MERFLGIDIGGTFIKIAETDNAGVIKHSDFFPTESASGPDRILRKIRERIASRGLKNIRSIGIGIAGLVDFEKRIVRFCPNLPGWKNIRIAEYFSFFKRRVYADNDANCAAWGCFLRCGLKRKSENMLVLTLGTGIGGGLIIRKTLFRGSDGFAGEIGHIKLFPSGRCCTCGDIGCLEAYAGTKGILRLARSELKMEEGAKLTPKIIAQAAEKGDRTALRVINKTAEYIGIGIATALNILNPDLVVLSGGISNAGRLLLDPINKTVRDRAMKPVPVIAAPDPGSVGVIGAALLEKSF